MSALSKSRIVEYRGGPPRTEQELVAGASAVANDGSVVEMFRLLPSGPDVELIEGLLTPNCSVLDLGTGAGRIADPLVELGHDVIGVDDSADMLAHVRRARTIRARIEELRIPEKFDAVLVASNLINYKGTELRRGLLATAAQHLKPTGKMIIEWRSPRWFETRLEGNTYRFAEGGVVQTMCLHTNRDGFADGEFTLECDGQIWRLPFSCERITCDELRGELDRVGLKLDTEDPESAEWLEASLRR